MRVEAARGRAHIAITPHLDLGSLCRAGWSERVSSRKASLLRPPRLRLASAKRPRVEMDAVDADAQKQGTSPGSLSVGSEPVGRTHGENTGGSLHQPAPLFL